MRLPEQQPSDSLELRPIMDNRMFNLSPVSDGSDDAQENERATLLSVATGYLSDDGTTPLIKDRSLTKRQKVILWFKLALKFFLANWYKFVALGLIITLIVLVSVKGFSIFGVILRWFQARNNWAGWGIFVGMYTGVVALFLPGVVFIMGAGFVFGFWKGLLAVWIGGAVGQALAFLLARYLLKDWVESVVRGKWKKWEYIDKAIELEGWKLVLIMRFSPLIPYNILNIAMATTSLPCWQFTIVSAIGIVWECAVFCYFGSMAENVTSIAAGEGMSGPFEWVMLGISLVMCVVGAVFVSVMVKKAIKRAEVHMGQPNLAAAAAAAMNEEGSTLQEDAGGEAPASLEREGFFRCNGRRAYARIADDSPQYEMKPVMGALDNTADHHPATMGGVARKLKLETADSGNGTHIAAGKKDVHYGTRQDVELGHSGSVPAPRRRSGSQSGDDFNFQ